MEFPFPLSYCRDTKVTPGRLYLKYRRRVICAGVLSVNSLTSVEAHHQLWKDILVDPARIPRSDQPVRKELVSRTSARLLENLLQAGKGRPKPRSLARKEHRRGIGRNSYHQVSVLH